MASTATRNVEKMGSGQSQATDSAACLGGGPKVSHSEEFLTQINTELTDEALFVAAYHMNPVPIKEKQTQDQGTQISKHGEPHARTLLSGDPPIPLVPVPASSYASLLILPGAWQARSRLWTDYV
uniref:Uncharacterized protein n=2 Tax=Phocoena sinus TaxID=42100 RepID=A0A8C9C3X8_PHOSS